MLETFFLWAKQALKQHRINLTGGSLEEVMGMLAKGEAGLSGDYFFWVQEQHGQEVDLQRNRERFTVAFVGAWTSAPDFETQEKIALTNRQVLTALTSGSYPQGVVGIQRTPPSQWDHIGGGISVTNTFEISLILED